MPTITILRAPDDFWLCKRFSLSDDQLGAEPISFPSRYDVENRAVDCLLELSELLNDLEAQANACVIRGSLREGHATSGVLRRTAGANDPFLPNDCQWLCIDIDDLELPDDLSDFNEEQRAVAEYAAIHLPRDFLDVDFHWQFSSSMGIKPGIRIHLWFWLSRPITDQEAKAWLTDAETNVDFSLFSPIQPHFTATPIFEEPAADPVQTRSGLFDYGLGITTVLVPDDLDTRVLEIQSNTSRSKRSAVGGRLDPYDIIRNEDGLVIDGRDGFLFLKSIDATQELTRGATSSRDFPSQQEIAERTWELFSAEADTSDGRWTYQDAFEKASYRIRNLQDGWPPSGRYETTTLFPGADPYFQLEPVLATEGTSELNRRLDDFLATVANDEASRRILALRITMGSGKTSVTVDKIQALLADNPDLNIEFYVPRHDLIEEVYDQFEGLNADVDLIHVKGRGYDHENGNAPCSRYAYVQTLERAGLSVRSNACWRSENEVCEFYADCAYFRQFRRDQNKRGSVRIFPHAYLARQHIDTLPQPDLVVIDETFLSSLQDARRISEARLRQILNQAADSDLGDRLVNALRDGMSVLAEIRNMGFGQEELLAIQVDTSTDLGFSGRLNHPRNFPNARELKERIAAGIILETLAEEIALQDREQVSRLRYDPSTNEVVLNRLNMDGIDPTPHLLLLDATADYSILNHLFGELEFHRIDIEQKAFVTQVYDRTGSNRSWQDGEDRVDDLMRVIQTHTEIGYRVLCVANMDLADQLRELDLGENAAVAHFGNIRGIDEFRDYDTIFITGRNQPPQSDIDGQARALWWDDTEPLQHDDAALFGALPETDLPKELRGYLTTNPDEAAGVLVRSFSDARIEAVHQQVREAETIQAIARLRMVHAEQIKNVYLLGNLPIEMPINRVLAWNDLMPNEAERQLIEKGNVPLTPTGWLRMRPDLAQNDNQAKNLNKRQGITDQSSALEASPLFVRLGCMVLSFKQIQDGKPTGRTQQHLFRTQGILNETGTGFTAPVLVDEWSSYLEQGDPEIEGSGWGPIRVLGVEWMTAPGRLIPYPTEDDTDDR